VPLGPDATAALLRDKRWGNNPMPGALGEGDLARAVGVRERGAFAWRTGGEDFRAVALPLRETPWSYVAALPRATFEARADDFLRGAAGAAAAALLLAAALSSLFARRLNRVVSQVAAAAEGLSRGELDQRVEVRSRDELGRMAEAFRRMVAYQK